MRFGRRSEVIDDEDVGVACAVELVDEVGADEAGAAGDDDHVSGFSLSASLAAGRGWRGRDGGLTNVKTGERQQFTDQTGEPLQATGEHFGKFLAICSVGRLGGEMDKVGKALERVVDLVGEIVGHGGGSGGGGVLQHGPMLAVCDDGPWRRSQRRPA